jgi:hypothetical protein
MEENKNCCKGKGCEKCINSEGCCCFHKWNIKCILKVLVIILIIVTAVFLGIMIKDQNQRYNFNKIKDSGYAQKENFSSSNSGSVTVKVLPSENNPTETIIPSTIQ